MIKNAGSTLLFDRRRLELQDAARMPMTRSRRSQSSELGLDVYPNQLEIISSEQMLDAYSSVGMPLMYQHWSFGKRFVYEENEVLSQGPSRPRL